MAEQKPPVLEFEVLFRHATIGIVVTDQQGKIMNINPLAEEQFGYGKKELIGQKIEALIPARFTKKHEQYRKQFYTAPHNRSMGAGRDLKALRKDGSEFPVEISLSFYNTEDNLYVIAFIVDISVRKKDEDLMLIQKESLEKQSVEIQRLNAELEKKVEDRTKMLRETLAELELSKAELSEALKKEKELGDLKSAFVTMASHEFRTPLSTILSSASLIGKYPTEQEQEKREKHLLRIKDAVLNMKNILEDFLSLGKLEEGLITAKPAAVTQEDFMREIMLMAEDMELLKKPGQQILFETVFDNTFKIDMHLFKNIFINLVSNAVKFSPAGTIINVSVAVKEKKLIFRVSDKGIGISAEDQKHLFERFFRAGNAANVQGTGLGLHIVAKYLEIMNGDIQMQTALNEGTTFIVTIPVK